jgi:hypothetical protein
VAYVAIEADTSTGHGRLKIDRCTCCDCGHQWDERESPANINDLVVKAYQEINKPSSPAFIIGEQVKKAPGGDYQYEGTIVGVIRKLSGAIRYVVEDSRGLLFIMNEKQLLRKEKDEDRL